ncbi:MAG: DUF6456 domain-containing protein [Pseudomonadota bacterium]
MSAPTDVTLVKALRKLSRRGAFVLREEIAATSEAGARRVGFFIIANAERSELARPVFQAAEARGFLRGETDGRWRLTRNGRAFLKGRGAPQPAAASGDGTSIAPARFDADALAALGRDTPLAWLRSRKGRDGAPLLSEADMKAGLRIRADFLSAQRTARTTVSFDATEGGQSADGQSAHNGVADRIDRSIAAQQRLRSAYMCLGPELAGVIVDVCCHDRGLAQVEKTRALPARSAKHFLQIGLGQLARHYGYANRGPDVDPGAS